MRFYGPETREESTRLSLAFPVKADNPPRKAMISFRAANKLPRKIRNPEEADPVQVSVDRIAIKEIGYLYKTSLRSLAPALTASVRLQASPNSILSEPLYKCVLSNSMLLLHAPSVLLSRSVPDFKLLFPPLLILNIAIK